MYLGLMLYPIWRLLELPDLSDDVGYLKEMYNLSLNVQMMIFTCMFIFLSHHSHLGEVHQAFFGEIGCSLLDEGQVCQIHSQVRHTRRVAAEGKQPQCQ